MDPLPIVCKACGAKSLNRPHVLLGMRASCPRCLRPFATDGASMRRFVDDVGRWHVAATLQMHLERELAVTFLDDDEAMARVATLRDLERSIASALPEELRVRAGEMLQRAARESCEPGPREPAWDAPLLDALYPERWSDAAFARRERAASWPPCANDHRRPAAKWPFPDARDAQAISTKHVVQHGEPILRATRHRDDDHWRMESAAEYGRIDGRMTCLACLLDRDPTLAEIADLLAGWQASRERVGAPWTRTPSSRVWREGDDPSIAEHWRRGEVYCDFNARLDNERFLLERRGSVDDLAKLGLSLESALGRRFRFWADDGNDAGLSDDLLAEGVVERDPKWGYVARIDPASFHHRSEEDRPGS